MIKGWHIGLVVGMAGLLTLFYQGLWGNPQSIPTVLIGTPAPGFKGPEVNTGETIALDQFRGKVVVLNFWASWCLECRLEHENLLDLKKRYGGHPDFVILGIDYQDRLEPARKYLEVYGTNFKHVRDMSGSISIDYGVYGVPETFVIDRQGVIRYKTVGPIVGPTFTHLTRNVIEPLLEGRAVSAL